MANDYVDKIDLDGEQWDIKDSPLTLSFSEFLNNLVGVIMPYGGTVAPTGFLLCNGQAVSRSTYSKLFSVIGVAFGSGDGSTSFNLPDLRESTVKGIGENPNGTSHVKSGGLSIGEFLDDRVQTHTHKITFNNKFLGYGSVASGAGSNIKIQTSDTDGTVQTGRYGVTTEVKSIGTNFIIKY